MRGVDAKLLGNLSDRVGLRLLSAVWVLRTGVHLELSDQPAAQLVLGEHSPDGEFDGLAWIPIEQLTIRHGLQTAGSAGVTAGELVRSLLSGQSDLGCIHHDDEIAAVTASLPSTTSLASMTCQDLVISPGFGL